MSKVKNNEVTLQSQETRKIIEGEEVFGEVLFIGDVPINKEEYGEATVDVAVSVLKALGKEVVILSDLEPYDEGTEEIA